MTVSLKHKFQQWEKWLFGEDIHSIRHQLHKMIWDFAVFQCINEARKYAPKNSEGEILLNGTVHDFINRCFFQTQALGIRRLLDKREDVISLGRMLGELEKQCDLLTRQNILDALCYPYDYEAVEASILHQRVQEEQQQDGGDRWREAMSAAHMHQFIDEMAGVDPAMRTPDDKIRKDVLLWMKARLDALEGIYRYVNKFFAHSATPESRALIKADEVSITLGKIQYAHQILCETATFVGLRILYRNFGGFLAIPQFDQFEHFEKPWATDEVVGKLRDFWNGYEKQTNKWTDWNWQEEFGKS